MENKKQMDDITQFIWLCLTPVILASIPIGYVLIKSAYYSSQLPTTNINF